MYPTALCQSWSRFRFQHIYFLFSPLLLTTRANNFRVVKIEALTDIFFNFSSGIKTNVYRTRAIIGRSWIQAIHKAMYVHNIATLFDKHEPHYFLQVCPIFPQSQQMSWKIKFIKVKINFLSDFIAECPNWNFNINGVLTFDVHTIHIAWNTKTVYVIVIWLP